ncbi:6-pyruvoyl trahydropterin synthase family protein [Helicobacter anatolicus]|uniref:6-pyruvoyl trahydropterin synthase family protein n=1 Tax=Helicobacter anatolicus TaxID=2905874 RepID=UPI001E2CDDFF|nr:6-carboxytetrahydropterin synthase [Helicobacter anatolicus]MCE3039441.1 6-carboxytetrahydropterin synthase [Helicobacter anatolicus]
MIIRRSFNFCAAHIVRNCTSERCSRSLHGHNYKVEVFVSAKKLDNAGMVLDFGIFKNQIAEFIDSFDHAHHFWNKENEEVKNFYRMHSKRYVELSVNPSAENYALLFLYFINKILGAMQYENNEGEIILESVRVHETENGYAEAFKEDLDNINFMREINLESIIFSKGIVEVWKDRKMMDKMKNYYIKGGEKPFKNPIPTQQILC